MSELPEGWATTPVKQLLASTSSFDPSKLPMERFELWSVPSFATGNPETLLGQEIKSSKQIVQKGDVLLCKIVPHINRVWTIETDSNDCRIASGEWIVLRDHGCEPKYLRYCLSAPDFRAEFLQTVSGVGGSLMRARPSEVAEILVPVAPKAEQRRIVEKLDALTARTARARADLDRIPALAARYRQAVLEKAFSGELTADWRAGNCDAPWTKSTIGEVAAISSGQTPKGIEGALQADGEIPWFKVSSMNLPSNLQGLQTSDFCLSRDDVKRLRMRLVEPGSVAFPKRGGAIATNKKRKVLVESVLDLNIMVLTAKTISSDYLWWWMQGLDLATLSNGSNVPQINNGDVEPLEINVPPVEEQTEIAHRLEAAFADINRMVTEAAAARRLLDRLDQAVLAKAFRGELVPQDPSDEPASVLLDRIRAERAAAPKAKRGRRKAAA